MQKIIIVGLLLVTGLFGASDKCKKEVDSLLDKVSFAKQFNRTADHYVAYKQAEDAMRACRYQISDNDMMNLIEIKNNEQKMAGY